MPIIINDFEVVLEPPDEAAGSEGEAPAAAEPAAAPSPMEIEDVLAREAIRRERVRAH